MVLFLRPHMQGFSPDLNSDQLLLTRAAPLRSPLPFHKLASFINNALGCETELLE